VVSHRSIWSLFGIGRFHATRSIVRPDDPIGSVFYKAGGPCPKQSNKLVAAHRITSALLPKGNIAMCVATSTGTSRGCSTRYVGLPLGLNLNAGDDMRVALKSTITGLIGVAAIAATTTAAKPRNTERVPLLSAVTQCRAVADPAARLACFDRSVAALDTAETNKVVVVIDQQQVRETRRGLFGVSLPNTGLFGNGNDLPQIETTLTSASVDDSGRWSFVLADGVRWTQTDDYIIARRPRTGDKVIIKRAALGSFRLSVGGQPGVKARRQN
jgi:hypothetical protein